MYSNNFNSKGLMIYDLTIRKGTFKAIPLLCKSLFDTKVAVAPLLISL
jgi:hypothetical protein